MFESIDGLSADRTLSRAAGNARRVKLAQAESLVLAAHWADLHGECPADHPEAPGRSLPGMERLVSLGGEGTPEVAEFAPAELASELGLSDGAGRHLMAEALDLRHRLPQLWAKVTAGEVRAYIARQVAGKTRDLDPAAAAHVDEKTCTYADTLSWGRLEPVVNAAIIAADPELAQAKADEEATRQGVFSGRKAEHGVKTMFIRARTADVNSLDAYVHAIADQLGVLGDSDCKDLRRAKALGYVHDPDAVWTLFNQPPAEEPADADEPPQSDPGPDPDDHDAEADP
ncbi:MAG: DUF222 domain-containing protein, partial [Nocardioidaceae bacterium]